MSRDWTSDLVEFERDVCSGDGIGECVQRQLPGERVRLRCKLMLEELTEAFDAMGVNLHALEVARRQLEAAHLPPLVEVDPEKLSRELVDLAYVTIGTAVLGGYDLAEVWDEVHAANMRKAGGPVNAAGKRLKPPGWQPPNVKAALARGRRFKCQK